MVAAGLMSKLEAYTTTHPGISDIQAQAELDAMAPVADVSVQGPGGSTIEGTDVALPNGRMPIADMNASL